ncbi:MAG: hypothetical protein HC854_12910 [Flavobacterium sp.]|nr:hypothetical protein [Flavobacterium sp.]
MGFLLKTPIINQDSDYTYVCQIFKFSNHFNVSKKEKYSWEILVEPSYYRSKHESFNYWHAFFTKNQSGAELRDKYMPLKNINEYVLNLGIIYRYNLNLKWSVYAMGNVGLMYIDTDTERMKKVLLLVIFLE